MTLSPVVNQIGFAGKDFLVAIQDPADSTGATWKTIAGLRATSGDIADTFFDVTTKDNMPWSQQRNGGIRKMTMSLGGVFEDAPSLAYLNWLVAGSDDGGVIINFQLTSDDGDMFQGPFAIKTLARSGPHTAEETWTMSLESASNITYTAPTPTLVSCTPNGWAHGTATAVVLKGTKFMLGSVVQIGGDTVDAAVTVVDSETINITIPIQGASGAIMITILNPDQQATSPLSVTLT